VRANDPLGTRPDPVELYEPLFRAIQIGDLTVPNRIVRTSHQTGLGKGGIGDDLIAYHRARAQDGVGLTVLERGGVHRSDPASISLLDNSVERGYERLRKELAAYPMRIFQQLGHAGNFARTADHEPPWSPSAVPSFFWPGRTAPRAMSLTQIEEIIDGYATAARRVVEGGLDGVEIHGGHGLLIAQFLSPLTNRREDRYGGSPENRRRLLVDVLTAVQSAVGGAIPVGVRLSADEETEGGTTVEDTIATVQALETFELVDFLDLSIGTDYSYDRVIGGMEEPHGYQLPITLRVAEAASIPTIVAGRIKTLKYAADVVRSGAADLISIVRAYIADPDIVAKSLRGQAHRVRPCIACNQGCIGGNATASRIGCTVNPQAGWEARPPDPRRSRSPRRVVVAGGGPSGMETARVAAGLGHDVLLCEQRSRLGGQIDFARRAPHRAEIGEIVDWLAAELQELGVEIKLGSSVDGELLRAVEPDVLVIATGGRPRKDGFQVATPTAGPIPGLDLPQVHSSWEVLAGEIATPKSALVYDDVGHFEAASVCESLLEQGATVTLATRHSRIAPLLEPARVTVPLRQRLADRPFAIIADSVLDSIDEAHVFIRPIYGQTVTTIAADCVVPVLYNDSNEHGLADAARAEGIEVHIIGDALAQRFLQVAIAEGNRCGAAL
jgi:2,4-dienoyl-CoA reductase-like NADH-dependent reductase (Old Yellow Enzyme family)